MSITLLTAMSEPPRRFDVFTGTGRRRSFTAAEKTTIVARRHGLSSSQLFTWRRLAQPQRSCEAEEPPLFVPVVMSPEPEVASRPATPSATKPCKGRRRSEGASIELKIDGVVVRVGRDADAGAIAAVISALKAGTVFAFRSKRAERLKLLFFDGTGVVLVAKRLEAGAFGWPKPGDGVLRLTATEMAALVHVPRDVAVPRLAG